MAVGGRRRVGTRAGSGRGMNMWIWRVQKRIVWLLWVKKGDGVRTVPQKSRKRRGNNWFRIGTDMLFLRFLKGSHTQSLWLEYPPKTLYCSGDNR